MAIPQFESAEGYVAELENWATNDLQIRMQVANFYVKWALAIKAGREIDFDNEKRRRSKYQSLADQALNLLLQIPRVQRDDTQYHLMAECYYIKWEYDKAIKMIERAEKLSDTPLVYGRTRYKIESTRDYYYRRTLES
jgi:hypothetical protein